MRSRSSLVALAALILACGIASAEDTPAFFLVASPKIIDPNFRETVVLVLQHSAVASRGVIINRRLNVPLSRVMPGDEAFRNAKQPVHFGGPVALSNLSFVFRSKARHDSAMRILDDLNVSADAALLRRLLRRGGGATEVRVYAGHAGWAPGQLENEIERGSWFATSADARYIFTDKPDRIWNELVQRASTRSAQVDYTLIR